MTERENAACAECGGSGTWPHHPDEPARLFHNRGCSQAQPATAALIGPGHPYGDYNYCACPECHQLLLRDQAMRSASKWRKKPVVIDALQLTEDNGAVVAAWSGGILRGGDGGGSKGGTVIIDTLEGRMVADVGDYVIRGVKGEHYPCKPDIFEATYEPA